jgi:nucleotide-binding universal stress UspA family protein
LISPRSSEEIPVTDQRPEPLVVVGVDGSDSSKAALRWAAQFATITGGHVDVITAWHIPSTFAGPGYVPAAFDQSTDYEKVLGDMVDEVFGPHRPRNMQLLVREGSAARVLLEASKQATLLVVGSRGHGGFSGLLLGSVSAKVAEHATCPVLIIHGNGALPEVRS